MAPSFRGLLGLGMASMALATPLAPRDCDCWRTEDSTAVFTNYKLVDFRSLSQYAGSAPAAITTVDGNAAAGKTSDYFNSDAFSEMFGIQTWSLNSGTVDMVNSANNVYLQTDTDGTTYMTLRTARESSFQSAAELDSVISDYSAASIRVLARTHGDAGGCTGIFTYKALDDGSEHESDMEILTQDATDKIYYTTHPESENSGHTTGYVYPDLPNGNVWTSWQEYRMDWTQPTTTFYLNDVQSGQLTHSYEQQPSYIILNSWSRGESDWEGTMAVGGSAYLDVKYIEIAYNRTSTSGTCSNVCSL